MPPQVSINLCCYNSERYLRETLDSIVTQSFSDWELIVVDDGSKDNTGGIIKEYINRGYPVFYYPQENRGLGYSRNKALTLSGGEFIAFIDHDDLWLPDKLEKQVKIFRDNPDVDFVYSNFYTLKNGRKRPYFKGRKPEGEVFKEFILYYPVAIVTVMVRKSALDGLNSLFDERLVLSEEYDLFMRLLYRSKAKYIKNPLAIYRIHSEMGSLRYLNLWPEEMEYILDKMKKMDEKFQITYKREYQYMKAKVAYYRARVMMSELKKVNARKVLAPHKFTGLMFFMLYLLTYMPFTIWNFAHRIATRGAFSAMGE